MKKQRETRGLARIAACAGNQRLGPGVGAEQRIGQCRLVRDDGSPELAIARPGCEAGCQVTPEPGGLPPPD